MSWKPLNKEKLPKGRVFFVKIDPGSSLQLSEVVYGHVEWVKSNNKASGFLHGWAQGHSYIDITHYRRRYNKMNHLKKLTETNIAQ